MAFEADLGFPPESSDVVCCQSWYAVIAGWYFQMWSSKQLDF